jgi:hypothetical protein
MSARHTPETVRAAVERAIEEHRQLNSRYSWPDDSCAIEPWGYEIHVGWVEAWNDEGRKTAQIDFLRQWLANDEHILSAFERAADFANGDPPGWPTRPGQSELRKDAEAYRAQRAIP